tara:strand:- start:988 stop:1158 length:171 start_codon:yes stop_codon:yes gene_type:complete
MSEATIDFGQNPSDKIRFCVHWLQVFVMSGRGEEAASMVERLYNLADELEEHVDTI